MEFDSFVKGCDAGRCPRGATMNKKCKMQGKRRRCFRQYSTLLKRNAAKREERKTHSQRVAEQRAQAMLRDKSRCKIWATLSTAEREYVQNTWPDDFNHPRMLTLSMMHIIPKSSSQKMKYDVANVVMGREFFHRRLDQYRHPVTNKRITKKERLEIMRYARDYDTGE